MMRTKAGSRTGMSSSSTAATAALSSLISENHNNSSRLPAGYGASGDSAALTTTTSRALGSDHSNDVLAHGHIRNSHIQNPTTTSHGSSALSASTLPRSAADVFKAYTSHGGLEFGPASSSSSSSSSVNITATSNSITTTTTTATTTTSSTTTTKTTTIPKPGTTKAEIVDGAKRLAKELDDFIKSGSKSNNTAPFPRLDNAQLSDKAVADLQLATARKLRELLPTNRELLHVVQERNWIPLLLSWLNLHDRPAVQVEALLALTNMAELCAQQTYIQHQQQQQQQHQAAVSSSTAPSSASSSAVAAAAAAAQAAAMAARNVTEAAASTFPSSYPRTSSMTTTTAPNLHHAPASSAANAVSSLINNTATAGTAPSPATYPYPSLVTPPQASVPFPPLSFSQTLSPEAVAAFDASLTSTLQQQSMDDAGRNKGRGNKPLSMPPAPLYPSPPTLQMPCSSQPYPSPSGGIDFSSMAPPPGGPHTATLVSTTTSTVPSSNAFLPPPTPIPEQNGKTAFPQQLSASSQHLLLRHADAIPTLISLLASPNREVYEQALWILGSIAAGGSPGSSSSSGGSSSSSSLDGSREKTVSARDVILAAGVMNHLPRCLERHPNSLSLQRIGSWTLSNLVEGIFQQQSHGKNGSGGGGRPGDYSSSDEIDMETLLPILHRLLHTADAEVLSYTCWTLSHLCDGPSSHIAAVVTSKDAKAPRGGLVPRLVDLLLHPSWRVTKPALRTIGNIVCAECSDDNNHSSSASIATTAADYTEVVLECGAVPRLKELVTHNNREIQKEACWTLSNIAAGTVDQIQAVVDSGAIPPLVKLVNDKKTDQEVRSEACWVVLNATSCGSDSQIEVLVDEGCVSVLSVLLSEASMAMMALEGLERVLQVEEAREMIRREQIESGEIDDDDDTRTPTLVSAALIEKALEKHNSSAVTKRAGRIWKQHFVSCALCHQSFSKHRTTDATFCEECKCYVCCNCDCKVYHLSYQEELWAATEEKTEAKKNAKKSKNKKKKEKLKQKKSKKQDEPEPAVQFAQDDVKPSNRRPQPSRSNNNSNSNHKDGGSRSPTLSSLSDASDNHRNKKSKKLDSANVASQVKETLETTTKPSNKRPQQQQQQQQQRSSPSPPNSDDDDDGAEDEVIEDDIMEDDDEDEKVKPDIDFVLYLQQTGSIIALAKLMDALEYGEDYHDDDADDEDADLKLMIRQQQRQRQQQVLNRQQQATI